MNAPTETATARTEYRALRATVKDLTKIGFDSLAQRFVHEIADGERERPCDWVMAARWIASGERR